MTSRRPKVLVLDNEAFILAALRRALRNYEVTTLDDAEEALRLLTSGQHFDVILCDVNMPRMRGPEIRETLYRLRSPLAGRFIWMSGAPCPVDGPFLAKPYLLDELEQLLALVCNLPS